MVKPALFLSILTLTLPLLLACGRPAADILHQQPAPTLSLEVSLPEGPEKAALKSAYLAAFHDQFGQGLATDASPSAPDRLRLLVMIGDRSPRPASDDKRNRTMDQVSAVATASPLGLLHSTLGPKSDYEQQVDRLGYRPGYVTGQVVVLRIGKNGFQEYLRLNPMPIVKRMQPLGEDARATGGIMAEEGHAVAAETLALLRKKFGWAPPTP